jgi:hypothetical protein
MFELKTMYMGVLSNSKGFFFSFKKNTTLWITKSRFVQRKTSSGLRPRADTFQGGPAGCTCER